MKKKNSKKKDKRKQIRCKVCKKKGRLKVFKRDGKIIFKCRYCLSEGNFTLKKFKYYKKLQNNNVFSSKVNKNKRKIS